ncbi:trypsin-like peptidase domain-containing protein [bacterium]|nr:trypsin-like peptidase domain-containing protein [bacterium]MBU1674772.1 trypsin-like peptidase domain-containing protein [bacterium]
MRKAPVWTGIVIGVLFGLLLGAAYVIGWRSAPRAVATGVGARDTIVVREVAEPGLSETSGFGRRNAIVRATERVSPAVVSINAIQHRTVTRSLVPRGWEYFERFYPGMFPQRAFRQDVASMGSGVVVSDDGFILTNVHVVESADELVVALNDGRQYSARVLEKVPTWDLALIQLVEPPADLPVATLADPGDDLYIGEWAIAIGSPFGYLLADTQPTVTIGVISALNRDIKNTNSEGQAFLGMIQTDAAINPGNSGGPLVNSRGEVIGINTFIFTESGGSIGLGFAVPIARAQWIIREVRDFGYFRRAYVGFGIVEVNELIAQSLNLPSTDGFVVRDVISGSPAAKAGLQPYDVIISINGVALNDADTFNRLVYEAKVGTQLEFMAYREGKEFAGTIVLEEDPRRRE